MVKSTLSPHLPRDIPYFQSALLFTIVFPSLRGWNRVPVNLCAQVTPKLRSEPSRRVAVAVFGVGFLLLFVNVRIRNSYLRKTSDDSYYVLCIEVVYVFCRRLTGHDKLVLFAESQSTLNGRVEGEMLVPEMIEGALSCPIGFSGFRSLPRTVYHFRGVAIECLL